MHRTLQRVIRVGVPPRLTAVRATAHARGAEDVATASGDAARHVDEERRLHQPGPSTRASVPAVMTSAATVGSEEAGESAAARRRNAGVDVARADAGDADA